MSKRIPQDIIDQIERTDFHYQMYIDNLSIDEVLSLNDNVRVGVLKAWGEIMETYLKAILRYDGKSWNYLRGKGHNLKDIYSDLDDDSKEMFELLLMGEAREFVESLKSVHPKLVSVIAEIEKELGIISNDPKQHDLICNLSGIEGVEYANSSDDYSRPAPKKIKKSDISGKEYTLGNIVDMINAIKVAGFRYSGNKKLSFDDDFMILVYDAVKTLHKMSRIEELESKKSIKK